MTKWTVLSLIIMSFTTNYLHADTGGTDFDALLKEGGLKYRASEQWKQTSVSYHELQSNLVLVTPDGGAEAHLYVRPIGRMEIDYDDPHNSAPKPTELFPLLFETMTQKMSDHTQTITREYETEQAAKAFNADWASASVFNLKPDLSAVYDQGLLLAIHQHNKSDAYILVLTNDMVLNRSSIDEILTSFRYIN